MASEYSISNIITFMEIAQFNSASQLQKQGVFAGNVLDNKYSRKLYMIRAAVDFMNNSSPTNSTLRQVAEYGFALAKPYNIAPATISITNPVNQNLNVGQTAFFSVSVSVSNHAAFTVQWYRNGVIIPGATSLSYSLPNVQLTDNGANFNAIATAVGVGTAASASATLVVTASIIGFFSFSPTTDYYPILLTNSDPFAYQVQFTITHGSPIVIPLPNAMPSNQFMLAKIPTSETIKTSWFNTPLNNGAVPDSVFQSVVQFGGFTYYASRGQITMDVTQTLTFS